MTINRHDTLSAEQVEAGRRMREEHGTSWYRIGRTLGCEPKTIRRALDPTFDERMRVARNLRRKTLDAKRGIDVKARCAEFRPKRSFKRPQRKLADYESITEEVTARRRATKQDIAFIDAMTKAVRMERETCPIGVDTRPSTHDPKFVPARGNALMSVTGSHAQMCADFA